jgi:polyisoprenoid-binding protein YceI
MQTGAQRGLEPVKYQIDPTASRFTVQAFATGLLSSFGHSPTIAILDYDGEIQFVPETYDKAFVRVTVRTTAMDVLDEIKRSDLQQLLQEMNEKVLDVNRFPAATFESKQITVQHLDSDLLQAHVAGDLSFHGVTRSHDFDVRIASIGSTLRISGEFQLRQSDYDIKLVSFAAGGLRLKDEIKFKLELIARKQE